MAAELEVVRQVWNTDFHHMIEVGPDADGLGLVEIRYKDEEDKYNKTLARITIPVDSAKLLARAIGQCANEMAELEKKLK